MGGASQGFSAPEAAGPPPLADPPPQAGRQLVPGGPSSILVCQRRRNSQTCRQPSVHRGVNKPNVAHTPRNSIQPRKGRRSQHACCDTDEFERSQTQKGRGHTIPLPGGAQGALSERQKVGGGGQGSGEREGGFVFNVDRVSAGKDGGALAVMAMTLVQQLECA